MLELFVAMGIMIILTALATRRNSVAMLSLAFTLIYLEELALYILSPQYLYHFFETLGARWPPNIGIFTAIYLHSLSPMHVFFNILFFFLAGLPFERRVGSRYFVLIFLVSGIVANLVYGAFLAIYGLDRILVGASGAIFGIMGAFIIMYPEDEITFFLGPILLPRVKVKFGVLSLLIVEFLATLLFINDGIAHGAHVIGAVTGAMMGYYLRNRNLKGSNVRRIDEGVLSEMADTDKLREIYERIKSEDDEIIRDAWIERFMKEKFGEDYRIEGKYVIHRNEKYRIYR